MTQMMDFLSVFTDGMVAGSRILKIMDNEEFTPQQHPDANQSHWNKERLNFVMSVFLMMEKSCIEEYFLYCLSRRNRRFGGTHW